MSNAPLLVLLWLLALVAPAIAVDGDPVKGRLVAEKWCALCHSITGTETSPDRAPTFEQVVNRDGRTRSYLTRLMDEDHFPMTTYRLFDDEKRDVVAFLMTLKK